jgi:acetyl-CoA C-acetyltransferase
MERADLSKGPASELAVRQALGAAGAALADVAAFDFYSCFPIAVFNICDALGLASADPRGLTVTGGLPFFGGAGNNYSMHAIASMARKLRRMPGTLGLVGANGGFLTKYSVGIYSTRPAEWRGFDSTALQREVDAWAAPELAPDHSGAATIETYTVDYAGKAPRAVVIGRTPSGARFAAAAEDDVIVRHLIEADPLGGRITVAHQDDGRIMVTAFEPALATA